jgi:2-hydroxy-3-keto-5-methylthiopentenyl-1-phosphate phosphatase
MYDPLSDASAVKSFRLIYLRRRAMIWIKASTAFGEKRMKNLRDEFNDEEKSQLSYLGSMLGRPNTPEEQQIEDIWDAMEKASRINAGRIDQTPREGGAD